MARQVGAIRAGLSPSEAFKAEEKGKDAALEPLLAAINELLSQLSLRNQELVELNHSLELRVEDRTRVIRRDARKPGTPTSDPATLVFLDPPYGKGLGEAALSAVLAGGWIAPGALVVWEEGADITPPNGLRLLDSRRYGDTVIHMLERAD